MLISKRNQVQNIESGVDVQLQRRYDLIPNVVKTAKEYMNYEERVLVRVSELRTIAMNASNQRVKFSTNTEITEILGRVNVAIENYPELKANENLLNLQNILTETEDRISAARRAYNSAVMVYNNALEMFPTNFIAKFFGFKKAEFFGADELAKKPIKMEF